MTIKAVQIAFLSRFSAFLFILAKILRFAFFLVFLLILGTKTKLVSDYNLWQMIFFFCVFNLVDSITQFFLREVYRFRSYVVSGDFDYYLTKPISPLFRSLFGGSDILDLPMIIIAVILTIIAILQIGPITIPNLIIFLILILNGLILAFALHIFILAVGVLTVEIENSIMIYRDMTQMGRVPIDVYHQPLRALVTFAIPVGIMMTFPAKALMGLLSWQFVLIAILISLSAIFLSLKFWRYALTQYSSASS